MNILIAMDDSKFAEAAARSVIARMKTENCEIRLVHALASYPVALAEKMGSKQIPDFPAARLTLREQAAEQLGRIQEKFQAAGFKATSVMGEGDPREVILDYAEQWPADLIVLGSHSQKGTNRFLMGSVSEAVSRHARCSVEIVRIRSDK